jgi:hypothetical protein
MRANAIHALHRCGLAAVHAQFERPQCIRFDLGAEPLRALFHEGPRAFGKPRSIWTLCLATAICRGRGLTPAQISIETIRQVLKWLGVTCRRAKYWINSPYPLYVPKCGSISGS